MSNVKPVFDPAPRPALTRATDAIWHPTLPREHEERAPLISGSTSDAILGPKQDKLVALTIDVPKSIRKALRHDAQERGLTVDQLVTLLARDYLKR
ncbi:MAG: hypothetical protein F2923_03160 [Actinobacteria bacterium]|uniref:Unannotated protein n=1 Tax=freshwater metagenome TaxID=449393 RepID=A0A6J7SAG4_9ZZZZ|nr:hypothetical protein [Actinomycetota bacterium]MTB27622.1 hypothetical protein [Actinomycetota bacterium]